MKLSHVAHSIALALATSLTVAPAFAEEQPTETIVVTGQKIDRTLQETPNSVAVVTASDIEKFNIQHVADVFNAMPNVHGSLNNGFSIRGIDAFNVSGGGNSYLTSMYFDGAPMPFRLMRQGSLTMWDVSQVEIFRGPQSTIQGRNALAGAVIIRTQDPTYEWSGKGQITVGENGQREYAIAGGGELVDNQLAFRIAAETKDFDGFNYNETRQAKSDYRESDNYRAKLLFEPEAIPGLRALFTYTNNENEIGPRWIMGNSASDPRINDFDAPIFEFTDSDLSNLEISYELNENWTLDSITTYSDVDYGYQWDGDLTPAPDSVLDYDRNDKTFSQELRFTFDYDNLKGVFGLFYSDLDVEDESGGRRSITLAALGVPTLLTAPAEFGGLGLPQAMADQVLALYADVDPVQLGTATDMQQKVKSQAIFADVTWSLNDQWDIIAGARFDKEEQENASNSLYTIENADKLPDPAFYGQANPMLGQLLAGLNAQLMLQASNASGTAPLSDTDFDAFLPKLGVSYHFNDDMTLNAIYQKGYRSGGVGTNISRASVFTYSPEYTNNYELSLRSVWLDGELVVNANAFYVDWTDQQVQVQLSSNQYDRETLNAGSSTVRGAETEVFWYPTNQFTLTAGIGYSKTEFEDFQFETQGTTTDLSGYSFADAPELTANISADYRFDNGFYLNVNANYADSSRAYVNPKIIIPDFDFATDKEPENDGRMLVNAQFGYEMDNYKAFITVRNLLDREYVNNFFSATSAGPLGVNQLDLGEPRQISFTVQAMF